MTVDIRPFPRLGWDPLPGEADFFVAQLRFAEHATIHEHPGERDTIVACIEGAGYTSVGEETSTLREGQQVRWPAGVPHRLWTEDSTMSTLMVERVD